MKKRRAPKAAGSANGKDVNIIFRANALEKAGFKDAASLAGQTLSVWVRDRLRQAAKRELESEQKPVPFLEP